MNTTQQDIFNADLARFNAALAQYVHTEDDGFQWIDFDAPAGLVRAYNRLLSCGYANGYL